MKKWGLMLVAIVLASPRIARACWDCGTSDLHVVGVTRDGRIVSYRPGGDTEANCTSNVVTVHHAQTGASLLTLESQGDDCAWIVTRGKLTLSKADRDAKVDAKTLAERIAKRLEATAPRPSTRADRFTAHSVFDPEIDMAGGTIVHLRWDGEPVSAQRLANYRLVATVSALSEHPSSPFLFVHLTSHTKYVGSGGVCEGLEHDWLISKAEQAAHASLLQARALALTDPAAAAKILRQRIAAAGKHVDPLLKRRLLRTEIAAKKRASKRPDQCQVRRASLLGVGADGRVGWARRTQLTTGGACTTHEQIVVEKPTGELLVSHERKLPAGCDPKGVAWPADYDALVAQTTQQHRLTPAVASADRGLLSADPGNDEIVFYEEAAELGRKKWRTSSAAGSFALELLMHPATGKQFVQFRSTAPWAWADSRVCEDALDDILIVSDEAVADRRAVLPLLRAEAKNSAALAVALIPNVDRPAARRVFLSNVNDDNSRCHGPMIELARKAAAQKSLKSFAEEVCSLIADGNSCSEADEKRLRRVCPNLSATAE